MNLMLRQVYSFEDLDLGMEASLARTVSTADILAFSEVTGDRNPVHLDAEFAARTIFKEPIAHGMLTLSMIVPHLRQIYRVTGTRTGIVYGFNKIRFPQPVPSGARIRVSGEVVGVTDLGDGWQVELALVWEVEGAVKPAVVAELVLRHYR